MGKIFLIEPLTILEQGIALSLFPDHDVQVEKTGGAQSAGAWQQHDLLIVDAAALRQGNQLTPELFRAIGSSKTPTLWLEDDARQSPPRRANLLVVRKPIEKEAFHAAVTELLTPPADSQKAGKPAVSGEGRQLANEKDARAEPPFQPSLQFIDLVDVVEQDSSGSPKKKPRKPK